jgi:hypothetical protein
MEAGRRLCLALLIYCDVDVPKTLLDISSGQKAASQKKKKKGKTAAAG